MTTPVGDIPETETVQVLVVPVRIEEGLHDTDVVVVYSTYTVAYALSSPSEVT